MSKKQKQTNIYFNCSLLLFTNSNLVILKMLNAIGGFCHILVIVLGTLVTMN